VPVLGKAMKIFRNILIIASLLILFALTVLSCQGERPQYIVSQVSEETLEVLPSATPYDQRPVYEPGTLVDYIAQSGDSLESLAWRFGSSRREILFHNPDIPKDITTLPPGFPMKMPIYYKPFWGTSYQIIPDAVFVNGPDAIGFNTKAFLKSTPGWFKHYRGAVDDQSMSAAEMIDYYAMSYSLNPKLLLALVEYQTGALSHPQRDKESEEAFLGFQNQHRGVSLQISYVANLLNDYFYRYFNMELSAVHYKDGTMENVDPWQNSATVALQLYFNEIYEGELYKRAIGPDGFARTFMGMFGDPWARDLTVIPGSLTQPEMRLPFQKNTVWAYTGGPHSGWGTGKPWSALDFAPPLATQGCVKTEQFALAVADGVVARTGPGIVMLDLDGDGDERTGWVVLYLHIAEEGRVKEGDVLKLGDRVGHPSCEGGRSTGTHVHLARKYNGQWIPAASEVLPFNLSGWIPVESERAYEGWLKLGDLVVRASVLSDAESMIPADK